MNANPMFFGNNSNEKERFFSEFNPKKFEHRFASIYLPLISFKGAKDQCDVGTFLSMMLLIDFCHETGIFQIILDIEKVNNYFIIDPVHYYCKYDFKQLETYDIDSIRNIKIHELREKSGIYFQALHKEIQDFKKAYINEYISKSDAENSNLILAQYNCHRQLNEAFLYACQKNISIATIVYNDDDVEKKISFASQFSHSVYICNPHNKQVNKEVYKKIDSYPLTIMVDSSIAEEIKNENLRFVFPYQYQKQLNESGNTSFGTFRGPDILNPSAISEFPAEKSQRDIKHEIEERIYSDENISIIYFTDLLYITLPGAERDIYQPLKGKLAQDRYYMRYLYNFSVSDLSRDPNVLLKTKELLKNGNRYHRNWLYNYDLFNIDHYNVK